MQPTNQHNQPHSQPTGQSCSPIVSLRAALFAFIQNLRLNNLRPFERGFSTIYSYYYPRYAAAYCYSTQTNYLRRRRPT